MKSLSCWPSTYSFICMVNSAHAFEPDVQKKCEKLQNKLNTYFFLGSVWSAWRFVGLNANRFTFWGLFSLRILYMNHFSWILFLCFQSYLPFLMSGTALQVPLMIITMWDTSKDEAGVLSEHESGSLNPSLWCQCQLIFNPVVSMDHINRQINLRNVNSSLSDHFIGIKSTDTKQYFLLVGNKVPSWSLDETHFLYIVNILSIDQQT